MSEHGTDIEFDFFDEPETRETPPRERVRRRGPRRPVGPPSGLTPLLRLVGLISLAILIVVLLVSWISGFRGEAKKDRYADYMQDVSVLAEDSQKLGVQLKGLLTRPGVKQADIVRTLDGLAQQQEQQAAKAQTFDPPGPLRVQQRHVVEALQLRVSGLRGLADAFKETERTKDATSAGGLLAAQARRLVASDVLWDDLFKDPSAAELRNQDIRGVEVPDSNFLEDHDLATTRSMVAVWTRVRGAATGGTPTGPHGHSLVSVKVLGGDQLRQDDLNKVVATDNLAFEVTFENSGQAQEVGVRVVLTILKDPKPIEKTETIDLTDPNEPKTIVFRGLGVVPFVTKTTLKVEIEPVPGETNVANNSAEYSVIFSYPG